MATTVTRLFHTHHGGVLSPEYVVVAQLWYKPVDESAIIGTLTGTVGEREFSITESGLYYFYIGLGIDDLYYDPAMDEPLEAESYTEGMYVFDQVALSTAGEVRISYSDITGSLLNTDTFGASMSNYLFMIQLQGENPHYDDYFVYPGNIDNNGFTIVATTTHTSVAFSNYDTDNKIKCNLLFMRSA